MRVLVGSRGWPRRRFGVRWLFEPRDLWVGVFWNVVDDQVELRAGGRPARHLRILLVYVSLVPAFPLCFIWTRYA